MYTAARAVDGDGGGGATVTLRKDSAALSVSWALFHQSRSGAIVTARIAEGSKVGPTWAAYKDWSGAACPREQQWAWVETAGADESAEVGEGEGEGAGADGGGGGDAGGVAAGAVAGVDADGAAGRAWVEGRFGSREAGW